MDLPSGIRNLLWDVSLDQLTMDGRWEKLIIERVMERGCWDDMRWLLRVFDRARLRSFIEQRGRRVLAPRELRFWATICEVPEGDRDTWVLESRARERAWRG